MYEAISQEHLPKTVNNVQKRLLFTVKAVLWNVPNELMELNDLIKKKINTFSYAGQVIHKEEFKVFKQLLTGSYILGLLLVGNLSAQAQVQKPASPPAQTQPQSPATPQTQVSADELQKFARSVKQLIEIERGANKEMSQVIGKSGLSEQRFVEIYRSQQGRANQPTQSTQPTQPTQPNQSNQPTQPNQPNQSTQPNQPTKTVTPQEKQQFDKAFTRLGEIQKQAESKMQQVVQKEGLEITRFNQIEAAVRQDPSLQQKVREMIQS